MAVGFIPPDSIVVPPLGVGFLMDKDPGTGIRNRDIHSIVPLFGLKLKCESAAIGAIGYYGLCDKK